MEIDLKIVATRRPDLLGRTLDSLIGTHLKEFTIRSAAMNLDPAFGDEADADACRTTLRQHFPDAVIHEPATASFGGAVKRLWAEAGARPIFHLEDDWVALAPFPLAYVEKAFADGYGAVTPLSEHHNWDRGSLDAIRLKRRRIMGFRFGKIRTGTHDFGTSPRFIQGPLAKRMAEMMDPDLDPEKQMEFRPLSEVVESFRSVYLTRARRQPIIEDIGREWRDARGIVKKTVNAKSIWIEESK